MAASVERQPLGEVALGTPNKKRGGAALNKSSSGKLLRPGAAQVQAGSGSGSGSGADLHLADVGGARSGAPAQEEARAGERTDGPLTQYDAQTHPVRVPAPPAAPAPQPAARPALSETTSSPLTTAASPSAKKGAGKSAKKAKKAEKAENDRASHRAAGSPTLPTARKHSAWDDKHQGRELARLAKLCEIAEELEKRGEAGKLELLAEIAEGLVEELPNDADALRKLAKVWRARAGQGIEGVDDSQAVLLGPRARLTSACGARGRRYRARRPRRNAQRRISFQR
eukprot:COSAG04_NODE_515_length_13209_cov_19.059115_12_plen_284_part_00